MPKHPNHKLEKEIAPLNGWTVELFASPHYRVKAELGAGRITEKNGSYFLDNQPIKFDDLVRAANRGLKAKGLEQILNNPAWGVGL
jgi:hypothetical protein